MATTSKSTTKTTTKITKPIAAPAEVATTRDEIKALSEEIELKLHLAKLDAADEWADLKKRLLAIEQRIAKSGVRAGATIGKELEAIGAAFKRFRDDVVTR